MHSVQLHNKESQHQTWHPNMIMIMTIIYFNLFEWCIRCRSTRRSRGARPGTRILLLLLLILVYFNGASGASHQQGVAAPNRATDFVFNLFELCIRCRSTTTSEELRHQIGHQTCFYMFFFNLFEWCIRCRSTSRSRSTRRVTRLFIYLFNLFILFYLNCASGAAPQQGFAAPDRAPYFYYNCCLSIYIYLNCAPGAAPRQRTRSRGTRQGTRMFFIMF
jgi:hypothetical protein